jgi:SAM-dependent methyltransferase
VSAAAAIPQPELVGREHELRLLNAVHIHAFERLLFVGCGDGWLAEEAWRRGLRAYVCGLEASPALVAHATELRGLPGKLEFKIWDERRLPLPSGSFDRVFGICTLQRAPDAAAVLDEMRRVLAPSGEVCLLEREWGGRGRTVSALATALALVGFAEAEEMLWDEATRVLLVRTRLSSGVPA